MRLYGGYQHIEAMPTKLGTTALLKFKGEADPEICIRLWPQKWRSIQREGVYEETCFEGGYLITEIQFPTNRITDVRWRLIEDANVVVSAEGPAYVVIQFTPTAVSLEGLNEEIEIWRARAKKNVRTP